MFNVLKLHITKNVHTTYEKAFISYMLNDTIQACTAIRSFNMFFLKKFSLTNINKLLYNSQPNPESYTYNLTQEFPLQPDFWSQ